jgi:hypothetical protein
MGSDGAAGDCRRLHRFSDEKGSEEGSAHLFAERRRFSQAAWAEIQRGRIPQDPASFSLHVQVSAAYLATATATPVTSTPARNHMNTGILIASSARSVQNDYVIILPRLPREQTVPSAFPSLGRGLTRPESARAVRDAQSVEM